MQPIHILIVDDHWVVRQGTRTFLETQPDLVVVGEAENGTQAVAFCQQHLPDVVLMDLVMPGLDGVAATRQIRRISPRTQVIVLTSYHSDEHIFPAIHAGALSYVLKDIAPQELLQVIRKAAQGEATLNAHVATRIMQELRGNRTPAAADLSERELEVLRLIAAGNSNAAIAEALVLSEKTVKGHVSNILSKLHLQDRTQAAVYAWREGVVRK